MKVLGYPHAISMDSFRTPHFELVADCLHWLIMRYNPSADLDTDISVESRRVAFLKRAAHILLSGARLKLNLRRLYSGDGYAVKELLKVAQLLYNATNAAANTEKDVADLGPSLKPFDIKATRLLVSEITKCGASLHDVLENEPSLQEARSRATLINTDMDEIERSLKESISEMLESISAAEEEQSNYERNEKALEVKLEKRKLELERSEKRVSTLHNVRPAYMDKYEVLQKDLHELFATYSEKHRNLQWLQSQLEEHRLAEQEKLEEAERRMRRLQRRLHEEGPSEWIHSRQVVPEPPGNVASNPQSRELNNPTKGEGLQNQDDTKARTSNSPPISPNASDISGDLEEGDDELVDMDGLDLKDNGEDDSTDDDF
ncbi:hypothetical protein R1flu_010941 [Riccia fluitans]|uniref:Clusterin-associated protein 1 n=1 Tax=Riccia fluitans TaxID=41844 RepID=A0ABD1Z8W1_9MARC